MRISDWSSDVCSSDLSSILAIRTSVSNDMEPDPSVRLLTDWFQPPRVGEGRRGASRSFLSRDGRAHLDNRFAEIAAFEHADKRLGRIGKTLGDILPELDAPVDRKSTSLNSSH